MLLLLSFGKHEVKIWRQLFTRSRQSPMFVQREKILVMQFFPLKISLERMQYYIKLLQFIISKIIIIDFSYRWDNDKEFFFQYYSPQKNTFYVFITFRNFFKLKSFKKVTLKFFWLIEFVFFKKTLFLIYRLTLFWSLKYTLCTVCQINTMRKRKLVCSLPANLKLNEHSTLRNGNKYYTLASEQISERKREWVFLCTHFCVH